MDSQTFLPTLEDLGVSRFEAHYWQKVAAVPEETRQAYYRMVERNAALSERGDVDPKEIGPTEITTSGLLRYHQMGVHRTSAEDEWLTPEDILTRSVTVLGAIDLDPCSNTFGPPNVPAELRFTEADDGLAQPWQGRVFMNPPYGDVIGAWVEKLSSEHAAGRVPAAIALVPARTDTAWFAALRDCVLCFVRGRLRFSDSENSAPFPSVVAYFGNDHDAFVDAFSELGDTWLRLHVERRR